MGVTKREARKRFIPNEPGELSTLDAGQGYSRFTERARNVGNASQNEAHAANNNEISTAHLLLGLLCRPDALAAKAIVGARVSLAMVRLGHNYIGTEHILPAPVELEDGGGILTSFGIDKAKAEANIIAAIAELTGRAGQ
jgi:ATP-dependent Clp protease ATP-binding subunit ClpA